MELTVTFNLHKPSIQKALEVDNIDESVFVQFRNFHKNLTHSYSYDVVSSYGIPKSIEYLDENNAVVHRIKIVFLSGNTKCNWNKYEFSNVLIEEFSFNSPLEAAWYARKLLEGDQIGTNA